MKRFEKYLILLVLPLMACSTSKMSSTAQDDDNVYVSKAKAKEYEPWVAQQNSVNAAADEPQYNSSPAYQDREADYERYDESDYMSYSSRIYRFNYTSPWRNYYDPWYDPFYYDSRFYYYDRFYWRTMPSWSFNMYFGNTWFDPWYGYNPYWRYRYWDVYSYYRTSPYPYYGGGYWGGGWAGVYPNYPSYPRYNRPRPSRNTENGMPGNGVYRGGVQGNGSRADRYNGGGVAPSNQGRRPDRSQNNASGKGNNNSGQSRPSRAERYSPPPSRNENNSSGSSRSNDSNESKPRPSRSGGR